MPYLNWKEKEAISAFQQAMEAHSRLQTSLVLSLGENERAELLSALEGVLTRREGVSHGPAPELRLDMPRGWAIFWKLRDGESRLLVAHPESDEWVATAALDAEHAGSLLEGLRSLASGGELRVSELGPVGFVSNCELVIRAL